MLMDEIGEIITLNNCIPDKCRISILMVMDEISPALGSWNEINKHIINTDCTTHRSIRDKQAYSGNQVLMG